MSKPVDRGRPAIRRTTGAEALSGTVARVGSARQTPGDDAPARDPLARLLETSHVERIVAHLPPETLHQLIRYRGLNACGELLASMTPGQLVSVLDLDLWRGATPTGDERLDLERFGEWLAALMETGDVTAARIVAGIDPHLVTAGLSLHIHVLDPATRAVPWTNQDEAIDGDETAVGDLASEVGGYVIRAKRTDAWDAIVALLVALDADHRDYFHSVMCACRRLSDSGREIDGLDELSTEPEQLLYDLGFEREDRRSRQGYLTPAHARAFLQMARRTPHRRRGPSSALNPIAAEYLRAADRAADPADANAQPEDGGRHPFKSEEARRTLDTVADLLAEAGLVPERPRGLLETGAVPFSRLGRIRTLIEYVHDVGEPTYLARNRELAFLANALMAGCSVQSRPFTVGEASDAVLATCNLGLEHWPACWPRVETEEHALAGDRASLPDGFLVDHDLVTAFEVGWAALHDMSMFVAERLVAVLAHARCVDPEIREGVDALRRELTRQREAATPWLARDALDVIAVLDLPAWASLLGVLDECPVLPAALTATVERRTGAVSATAFEFISTTDQIGEVRAFMGKLLDILLR
jgi:hypothetical protein